MTAQEKYYIIFIMREKIQNLQILFLLFILFFSFPNSSFAKGYDKVLSEQDKNRVPRRKVPSKISYEFLIEEAVGNIEKGRYGKAKELLWQAIDIFPQKPDAYVNLAIININEGQSETALRFLENAQRYADRQDEYAQQEILSYNFGLCFFRLGNYQTAGKYFSEAIGIYPEFAESFYYRGLINFEEKKYEQAFLDFFIARYLFEAGSNPDYQGKSAYFLSTIKKDKQFDKKSLAKTFYDLAKTELSEGDLRKALYFLQESVYLEPQNAQAYHELSLLYKNNKDYENAILYLRKAGELGPESLDNYLELASLYLLAQDHDAARQIFKQALSIDKKNPQIFYGTAKAYFQAGDFNAAKKYLKKAWHLARKSEDEALLEEIESFRRQMLESISKKSISSKRLRRTEPKALKQPSLLKHNNQGTFSGGYINP